MANEYYIINPNIDKEKRVNQIFEFIKDKQFYCAVAYAKVCKLREDEYNKNNNTKEDYFNKLYTLFAYAVDDPWYGEKAYDNFYFRTLINEDNKEIIRKIEGKDFNNFDNNFVDFVFLSVNIRKIYSYYTPNLDNKNINNINKELKYNKSFKDIKFEEKDLEDFEDINKDTYLQEIINICYNFQKEEKKSLSCLENEEIKKDIIRVEKESNKKPEPFDLEREISKYLRPNSKDDESRLRNKVFDIKSNWYSSLKIVIEKINKDAVEKVDVLLSLDDIIISIGSEEKKLYNLSKDDKINVVDENADEYVNSKCRDKDIISIKENSTKAKQISDDLKQFLSDVYDYVKKVFDAKEDEQANKDAYKYKDVYDKIYVKLKNVTNKIDSLFYKKDREKSEISNSIELLKQQKDNVNREKSEISNSIELLKQQKDNVNREKLEDLEKELRDLEKELEELEKKLEELEKKLLKIREYIAGLSILLYTLHNIKDRIDIDKKYRRDDKYQYDEYFYVPFLLSDDVLLDEYFLPDFPHFYFDKNFLPFSHDSEDEKKKELLKSIIPEYLIIEHAQNNKNIKYSFDDLKSEFKKILEHELLEDELDNYTNKEGIKRYIYDDEEDEEDDINIDKDRAESARQDFYGKLELADCFCQLEDVNILKDIRKDKIRDNAFALYINFHENIDNLYCWLCEKNKNFGYFSEIKKKYSDYIDNNSNELKEYWKNQIKNKYTEGSKDFKNILDFLETYKNYSAVREFLENNEKIYKYENLNDFLFKYVEKPNLHTQYFNFLGRTGDKKLNKLIEPILIEDNKYQGLLNIAKIWEDLFSTIETFKINDEIKVDNLKEKLTKLLSFLGLKIKDKIKLDIKKKGIKFDIKNKAIEFGISKLIDRNADINELINFEITIDNDNITSNNHQLASFIPYIFKNGFRIIFINYDFKFKNNKIEHFIDFSNQDEISKKHTIVFYNDRLLGDRRELSKALKTKKVKNSNLFLIIDRVVILFLLRKYSEFVDIVKEKRKKEQQIQIKPIEVVNDCLMSIILPFGFYQPYFSSTYENKDPDKEVMFVGRKTQLNTIINDPKGPFMVVYGGRQLGKSLLLEQATKDINRKDDCIAIYCDIRTYDYYSVFKKITAELKKYNVVNTYIIDWEDFEDKIKYFLNKKENENKKIYLFFDEVDYFIKSCKNLTKNDPSNDPSKDPSNIPFLKIESLSQEYKKRFNVVFAGLNLYIDLKEGWGTNHISGHLRPENYIHIKPFEIEEAVELIERPLHYLGLDFSKSLSLIYLILYNTNYYPCLIQKYCKLLLEDMGINENYNRFYSNGPIYYIAKEHMQSILIKKSFKDEIRDVFYYTLKLNSNGNNNEDNTFKYLANMLALLCYTDGYRSYKLQDFKDLANGRDKDIGKIEEICKLKDQEFKNVLTLLKKLSVFKDDEDDSKKDDYRFNRFSLFKLIGETEKDVRDNLKRYINEDLNKK